MNERYLIYCEPLINEGREGHLPETARTLPELLQLGNNIVWDKEVCLPDIDIVQLGAGGAYSSSPIASHASGMVGNKARGSRRIGWRV
jgi:hypothetical protein